MTAEDERTVKKRKRACLLSGKHVGFGGAYEVDIRDEFEEMQRLKRLLKGRLAMGKGAVAKKIGNVDVWRKCMATRRYVHSDILKRITERINDGNHPNEGRWRA